MRPSSPTALRLAAAASSASSGPPRLTRLCFIAGSPTGGLSQVAAPVPTIAMRRCVRQTLAAPRRCLVAQAAAQAAAHPRPKLRAKCVAAQMRAAGAPGRARRLER
jgi:hypothetical protein